MTNLVLSISGLSWRCKLKNRSYDIRDRQYSDLFYHKYKGENSFKILMRIREPFAGISKYRIQSFINQNMENCSKYPIFSNKEDFKPIIAKQQMERCQIDLIVFEKKPSKDENGNMYKYVLSCLDVFSRYIFLQRLK